MESDSGKYGLVELLHMFGEANSPNLLFIDVNTEHFSFALLSELKNILWKVVKL